MPIGKNSIARAAKVTNTQPTAPEAPAVKPVKDQTEKPAVTEHVIANISPEVVEKVTGIKETDPNSEKTKIVQILAPMPDYLL